jgi:hypothetical protein
MKLFEHPDFDQLLMATQRHLGRPGLTEAPIEKDYYVTEALRLVARANPEGVIFKGGTSLSKGWNLIDRFSEDLDLFVNPGTLGKKGIDRILKQLRDAVRAHPGLVFRSEESTTIGGFGRCDSFGYTRRTMGPERLAPHVLLEIGTSSGTYPTENRLISSYVGEYLRDTGAHLETEDVAPFRMALLHFRRTFVEKLFAIHAKVEIFKETGRPIGSYARHYYDLICLARQPEVPAMLESSEYGDIKADYERISLKAFPRGYRRPPGMSFADSDALYPGGDLSVMLGTEYQQQCEILCYGSFPTWDAWQGEFARLRPLL